jgi:hypothetical protein
MASCCRKVQQTRYDGFVGSAALRMTEVKVRFSLKPDETTVNRYVRFLGLTGQSRLCKSMNRFRKASHLMPNTLWFRNIKLY